jgi:hypothetical protein
MIPVPRDDDITQAPAWTPADENLPLLHLPRHALMRETLGDACVLSLQRFILPPYGQAMATEWRTPCQPNGILTL